MSMQPGLSPWWYTHRTKLLGAACVVAGGYVAYRTCSNKDSSISRLTAATKKYCDTYEASADLLALVVNDLKAFLTSDDVETPRSIRQLAKLLQAEEVQQTVQRLVSSVVAAVQVPGESSSIVHDVVDKIITSLLSEQGSNLVGLAVAKAAQHGTAAVCDFVGQRLDAADSTDTTDSLLTQSLAFLSSTGGERLMRVVVGEGISRAVEAYMNCTVPANYYEDLLGSLSKPQHMEAVRDIMAAVSGTFARELVTGFMQTPQQRTATTCATEMDQSSGSDVEEDFHDSVKSLTPKFARCQLEQSNPQWVDAVKQLSRQPEVQALAVEMTKTTVREAVGGVLQPFFGRGQLVNGQDTQVLMSAWLQRLYTMVSVLLSLLLYTCST